MGWVNYNDKAGGNRIHSPDFALPGNFGCKTIEGKTGVWVFSGKSYSKFRAGPATGQKESVNF